MRFLTPAVAAIALASALPALAADYPVLRGTTSPTLPPAPHIQEDASPWEGFYFGGLAGQSSINFNPGQSGQSQLASSTLFLNTFYATQGAANNLILPQYSARGMSFGGFAGYNMQFGEAVLGFEVDYMNIDRRGSGSGPLVGRLYSNTGNTQLADVTTSGYSESYLKSLASLRVRTGYAMGNIMPYLTGGLAVGYGEVTTGTRAEVLLQDVISNTPLVLGPAGPVVGSPSDITSRRRNAFMLGFTAGAGVEAMFGGLIVRGEYLFSRLQAQGGVVIDVNQARVGAGVKF